MRAGRLRHRITLERPPTAADELGEPDGAWVEVATVWAAVDPLTARELLAGGQVEHACTHRVRMRWLSGVTSAMRVVHAGRTLAVRGVRDIEERQVEIELLCEEGPSHVGR